MSYPGTVIWNHRGDRVVTLDGEAIGWVIMRSRVAAGTGAKNDRGTLAEGTRRPFYTALPMQRTGAASPSPSTNVGASIGTRYATAADARRALVLFHREYRPSGSRDQWTWNGALWRATQAFRKARKARWGF